MKKLISMLMAGVMVFALAVPAIAAPAQTFGDNLTKNTTETKVAGEVNAATLMIKMPSTGEGKLLILNPYGLKWTGTLGADTIATANAKTAQVIAPVLAIENKTACAVNVSATVTGKVSGNLKLGTKDATKEKTNTVFLQASFGKGKVNGDAYEFDGDATDLTVGTSAVSLKTPIALAAVDGTTVTANYVAFTFKGNAALEPTTPWDSSKDKVDVTIAWTFSPSGPTSS